MFWEWGVHVCHERIRSVSGNMHETHNQQQQQRGHVRQENDDGNNRGFGDPDDGQDHEETQQTDGGIEDWKC